MKKQISLLFLSLLLVGCGENNSSDKPSDESNATNTATSEILTVDIDDILNELSYGFSGTSLVTSGYSALGMNDYYQDYTISDGYYDFVTYNSASQGSATKDAIKSSGQYSPYNGDSDDASAYLSISELGMDNKITKYYITNGSEYLMWKDSGYYNPFSELFSRDFVIDSKNPYDLNLVISSSTSEAGLTALATALTGQIGFQVKSFTLKTNGTTATGYDITFEDINSSYGTMMTSATGIIREKGADLVTPLAPIPGTTIPSFDQAIAKYKTHNYRVEATLTNKIIKADVCQKAITYDFYHLNGQKYANYGYYQKGSSVQGITRIGDEYYEDGKAFDNSLYSLILPTMAISSVFFQETSDSTPEKRIYKFSTEHEDAITKDSATFAILKGSKVGDLSVIVESDKLTFKNVLTEDNIEIYTYYDLGQVTDFTSDIKEDCSSVTWSELLSNQASELDKLYSKTIAKEYLDLIPTPGKKRSLATLNFNAQRGDLAQILFSIDNYQDGLDLISDYEKTMANNGYQETEKKSQTKDVVFEKQLTVNGVTKVASVEVILGASFFSTPTIVFYFKLK